MLKAGQPAVALTGATGTRPPVLLHEQRHVSGPQRVILPLPALPGDVVATRLWFHVADLDSETSVGYDVVEQTWDAPVIPHVRHFHTPVAVADDVYIVGGTSDDVRVVEAVERLDHVDRCLVFVVDMTRPSPIPWR